ncbi:MAG: hypothetical protein SGJ27_28985 [Candidatus Melainabacteria bacterium]|nr:hypothetical protein [Candidatus Melainabacteria bacterium]
MVFVLSARTAAIFLSIALITSYSKPAYSQDLPPDPPVAPSVPAGPSEAPKQAEIVSNADAPTIAPGPLEDQRRKLLATIMTAKNYGFGTTAYLNAFNALEESVKSGLPEKDVKVRLDSIVRGLEEQLKRSQELKVQKPAPPIAASSAPPSASSMGGTSIPPGIRSAIQSGNTDGLMDKIKNGWFGGEIPDSIKKKIPANFDPSMLNSDQAKELMKKYGGGNH